MIRIIFENKILLNEKKMEQVEIRFQSESFLKAVKEFNEENDEKTSFDPPGYVYTPKSPTTIQRILQDHIPRDIKEKDKAEALDWMITSFIKTKDTYFFSKDIELFYQIKQKGQDRLLAKNSIYTIKDSIELHEIIEEAKPGWDAYNQAKANEKAKKDVEKGTNQIYENDDWKVFVPENKGASCDLAKGSEWCTGAIGLPYYEQYHKPDDPLIIFISRKETFKKKVKKYNKQTKRDELVEEIFPVKYQFHYGTNQFMDKDDRDIQRTSTWFELNSIVANMENPRISDDIKEKASDYSSGFEKLPNGGWKVNGYASVSYFDKDDKLHREDGPAFIEFSYDEHPLYEHWYIHGNKGRMDDGPTETEYYLSGKPKRQKWFTSGSLGRKDDKPTIISYDESGKITQKEWLDTDGIRNRKNGPALIRADGTKVWYYNGDKHRFDGPAWESPDEIAYFWMGNRVSKEEYEKRLYAYENIPFEESKKRKSLRIIFS